MGAAPRRIVRVGQLILILGTACLLGSVSLELRSGLFTLGMFLAGGALVLLASQLGNVNMSSVGEEQSSEVGGMQGVFQDLGSSLGTALIGSILIVSLSASFLGAVSASDLPDSVKSQVSSSTEQGVAIVPISTVDDIAQSAGLSTTEADQLSTLYSDSQVSSLRASFFALILMAIVSLLFLKNIPEARRRTPDGQEDEAGEEGRQAQSRRRLIRPVAHGFLQNLETQIGAVRHPVPGVPIGKRGVRAGAPVPAALVEREQFRSGVEHGHGHQPGRPFLRCEPFGCGQNGRPVTTVLPRRSHREHTEVGLAGLGAGQMRAADQVGAPLGEQHHTVGSTDVVGQQLGIDAFTADQVRLRGPALPAVLAAIRARDQCEDLGAIGQRGAAEGEGKHPSNSSERGHRLSGAVSERAQQNCPARLTGVRPGRDVRRGERG